MECENLDTDVTDDTDLLEKLARLPTFAHPTASPDGDEVALYYDVGGRNELHVYDVATGEREQWTDGEVPRNARWWIEWGGDGEVVYFHKDEDGNEQNDIHAVARDGGEAPRDSDGPSSAERRSADSRAAAAREDGDEPRGTVEPVVEMDGQVVLTDVSGDGDTLVFGSSANGQMNAYVHDVSSGETTKVTDYDRAVWGGLLSPDAERIAYGTNEADDFENRDVYVASVAPRATGSRPPAGEDADGSDPRNLEIGETGAESDPVDWGPDGEHLLVVDNSEDLGRCGVYDLRSDDVTWYGDLAHDETAVAFLPDGDRFLATRTRECATMPLVYDVETGEARELDLPEGVASFPQVGDPVLDDERVLVRHTTPTSRPELLVYDLAADEYDVLVEAEYGDVDPDVFADAEYLTFDSEGVPETPAKAVDHDPYDELEIEALLYDSGRRPSPLVVKIHGGPRSADSRRFNLYTQFLVSRGYSVLEVNYRGSTGRGRAFVEELYDDWGGAEQGDVAVGAEHVLDGRDWLDEDRVVAFGGSYGGFSAYWQMVQYPDLYDAGIAWIGLTDLQDMYENTMPHFKTELMEKNLGTPEDKSDLYEERSPVTHAANLDTPLLMVHGVNDRRVPVSQARIFRDELLDLGYEQGEDGDFEYEELGEEGHASTDQDQKTRMFRILDDFIDRRIGTEVPAAGDD
jgi:dipeptidyl aminopeptidase/acylaminoacyl peptidase